MTLLAASEWTLAFWTIAAGAVMSVACALLGCFLVLKRMSLMCDAIGHGMLPGIALAVMVTGQIASLPVLVGAMVFAVLTVFLAQALNSWGKVTEDASLGVVFTSLFALGVLLISKFVSHIDLDPGCIFYGQFETMALRTLDFLDMPEAFPMMLLALVLTVAFIGLFWKELQLSSFDAALATAMGFPAWVIHYALIALVAATTVTAFSALGVVVVLAMYVAPAAAAQMLADRLKPMLLWAAGIAVAAAVFGYLIAARFSTNIGGMMAVVAGAELLLAVLFAPRHGVVAKAIRRYRLSLRIAGEEVLARFYRAEEKGVSAGSLYENEHGFSLFTMWLAQRRLRRHGWLESSAEGWKLSDAGRQEAAIIVRGHRLWETFLTENFDLPLDHLHAPASRVEHFLGPELQRELAKELHQPALDPHGKSIPPAEEK